MHCDRKSMCLSAVKHRAGHSEWHTGEQLPHKSLTFEMLQRASPSLSLRGWTESTQLRATDTWDMTLPSNYLEKTVQETMIIYNKTAIVKTHCNPEISVTLSERAASVNANVYNILFILLVYPTSKLAITLEIDRLSPSVSAAGIRLEHLRPVSVHADNSCCYSFLLTCIYFPLTWQYCTYI